MKLRKLFWRALSVGLYSAPLVLSLAGSGIAADSAARPLRKVAVAEIGPSATVWPSFIADEKGFFARNGVEPVVTFAGSVANTVQQLVGGSADFASTTFDTSLRAVSSGAGISLVGSAIIKYPYSIMVAPAVKASRDLKGKSIILAFPKDITTVVWNRWLQEQGLKSGEVDQVYDGATPNRYAALRSNRVQAAMLTPPFDFRATQDGYGKLLDLGNYMKSYAFTAIVARTPWLKENADVARGYLRSLAEAIDWLYDPANKAEATDILARRTKQDIKVAAQTYEYYVNELKPYSRNLDVPEGYVETMTKMLVDLGDLKSAASVPRTFRDLSYLRR